MNDCGYAIDHELLSAREVDHLLAALAEIPRGRGGARGVLSVEAVRRVAEDPRVLGRAEHALGAGAVPFRVTLFDKSPRGNWLVTWHQDSALPVAARVDGWRGWSTKGGLLHGHAPADVLGQVVALRIHLDDSTTTNGPLRVVPGSHRHGVLADDAIARLVNAGPVVECLVPRGGVLAMRPLLLHASSKVADRSPRRVLHVEYATSLEPAPGVRLVAG